MDDDSGYPYDSGNPHLDPWQSIWDKRFESSFRIIRHPSGSKLRSWLCPDVQEGGMSPTKSASNTAMGTIIFNNYMLLLSWYFNFLTFHWWSSWFVVSILLNTAKQCQNAPFRQTEDTNQHVNVGRFICYQSFKQFKKNNDSKCVNITTNGVKHVETTKTTSFELRLNSGNNELIDNHNDRIIRAKIPQVSTVGYTRCVCRGKSSLFHARISGIVPLSVERFHPRYSHGL